MKTRAVLKKCGSKMPCFRLRSYLESSAVHCAFRSMSPTVQAMANVVVAQRLGQVEIRDPNSDD